MCGRIKFIYVYRYGNSRYVKVCNGLAGMGWLLILLPSAVGESQSLKLKSSAWLSHKLTIIIDPGLDFFWYVCHQPLTF